MKRLLCIPIIAAIAFIASCKTAEAQYAPCPQYGVAVCPPITTIVVDKTVQNPSTKDFVDNLGPNDPMYAPSQTVPFRLKVTNTGTVQIENIVLTDTIPQFTKLPATKGQAPSGNLITITVGTLKPGESKTYDISAQVLDDKNLPADQAVICNVTNKVDANSTGPTAHDEASFCISHKISTVTKGGLPVFPTPSAKITPPTGAGVFALIGLIPSGIAGLLLRRKTKKSINSSIVTE